MEIEDQADIFKRWEQFINSEWNKKNALCSYVKSDEHEVFRQWAMQKIIALFTMCEINGKRLQELERKQNS
jgi:hypothetical protein